MLRLRHWNGDLVYTAIKQLLQYWMSQLFTYSTRCQENSKKNLYVTDFAFSFFPYALLCCWFCCSLGNCKCTFPIFQGLTQKTNKSWLSKQSSFQPSVTRSEVQKNILLFFKGLLTTDLSTVITTESRVIMLCDNWANHLDCVCHCVPSNITFSVVFCLFVCLFIFPRSKEHKFVK